MPSNDQILASMMESITRQVAASLKETLTESITESVTRAVEQEVAAQLSNALEESQFYKKVNEDLTGGLKDIYQEIRIVRTGGPGSGAAVPTIRTDQAPEELFNEATDQLDAVLRTTEKAATDTIEIVEQLQRMQEVVARIVAGFESGGVTKEDREKLKEINTNLDQDLTRIMLGMTFQDLTGQRIKRIIEALRKAEDIVRQVIVTAGLMVQAHEEDTAQDFEALEQEAKTKAAQLAGPQEDSDQGAVDDLLSQFGL